MTHIHALFTTVPACVIRLSAASMLNPDINIKQTGSTVGVTFVISYYDETEAIVWPHMVYRSALKSSRLLGAKFSTDKTASIPVFSLVRLNPLLLK